MTSWFRSKVWKQRRARRRLIQAGLVLFAKNPTLIGILLYIGPDRPDVQNSIRFLSSRLSRPKQCDLEELQHLTLYLKGHKEYTLSMSPSFAGKAALEMHRKDDQPEQSCMEAESLLEVFTDADWAGTRSDRKSSTTMHVWLNGNLIFAQTRNQRNIALSSFESEFCSAVSGIAETLYLRSVVEFFSGKPCKVKHHLDNSSAKAMLEKSGLGRARHVDVALLWVQQKIAQGMVTCHHIPSKWNTSDLGTKPMLQREQSS